MKRTKIISYILILFSVTQLNSKLLIAQEAQVIPKAKIPYNKVEFSIGVLPSFSFYKTRTYNGQTIEGESVNNYGFGVSLKYNCSSHCGTEMGVNYNFFTKKYQDGYLKRTVNIKYLDIPLLFSVSTNKFLPVSFNVVCGPQIGFNAGSNVETTGSAEKDTLHAVFTIKQIDIDIAYGAGLNFSFSSLQAIHVGIGFRGAYGLTNINKGDSAITNGYYSILSDTNIKTYSGYLAFIFSF